MVGKSKLDEVWNHLKPYMDKKETTKDLTPICERCENWCGKEHDYSECLNQPCFKLWLSNEYYEWCESFRN